MYAMQATHKLIFGLKMLPQYGAETYAEFFSRLDGMSDADRETMLREAAVFVKLEPDEIMDLIQFCADPNGVPYGPANLKGMEPVQIHEAIVSVAMEVMRAHHVRLISEDEKKN